MDDAHFMIVIGGHDRLKASSCTFRLAITHSINFFFTQT